VIGVLGSCLTCTVIGLGIKYIDAAYDELTFSKRFSMPLAIGLAGLVSLVMLADHWTLVVFGATIVGVAASGKLDNCPFLVFTGIVACVALTREWTAFAFTQVHWKVGIVVCAVTVIDELGNDAYDMGRITGWYRYFFGFRGCLKLTTVLLAMAGVTSPLSALNLLSFDLGYIAIAVESSRQAATRSAR
jgi:hypothetical protein